VIPLRRNCAVSIFTADNLHILSKNDDSLNNIITYVIFLCGIAISRQHASRDNFPSAIQNRIR
jgi:hypothetical protein